MGMGDRPSCSSLIRMFVASLFYSEEYCYTSLACLFLLFAGRHDPSRTVTPFGNTSRIGCIEYVTAIFYHILLIIREPLDYIKDVFNYLDLSGYILILVTYVFRFHGGDAQWTCASFAILFNFIGIFKYSAVDR